MRSAKSTLAFCGALALAAVPVPPHAADQPHWEYSGERGPSHWGQMRRDYATCDLGRRQSPIDIVQTHRQKLPEIQFQYRPSPLRIANDGHTLRVRFANESRIVIGQESYALQQFHFHVPSGDRVQGKEYDMAAHFVHKSKAGGLAVVVVLFRRGDENAALASLWSKMPERVGKDRLFPDVTIDATRLLPVARGYYAYDGSLTAPPCTEGVYWMVLKQPVELSAEQLARFSTIFPNNARPVQALNGRTVKESP